MEFINIIEELKARKLLKQVTNESKLLDAQKNSKSIYCGFDPTADSLHVGHLIQILNLKRFAKYGFKPLAIVGGATAMIGDPSFKSQERKLLDLDTVKVNIKGISTQLDKLIPEIKVLDNADWINKLSLIDFLRDIGKHFNLAYLLSKENISSRIDKGLSITEFCYTMIQGYDFSHLYNNYDCYVQIGGSDQWGNITSGIDYISSIIGSVNSKACGLTINLLLKKDGIKFGKTESGTIWLDKTKTSEYEFYQFFLNQDDEDCEILLNFLTMIDVKEIETLMSEHKKEPYNRIAQKRLAEEITKFVHGQEGYDKALKISNALFSGNLDKLNKDYLLSLFKTFDIIKVENDLNILDFLISGSIISSKREGRELLKDKAISINFLNNLDENLIIDSKFATIENYILVKKGKKKYFVLEINK
ncbi:tyrosine--tRNA ligase [Spiroplasma turonicum]|uniref:Tyrosine--tRNA ligase n=1 Tax=Spiroplasma turonicum TaxID=216946 RepID=A0A0K1P5E2_9MOLU|nr:tyrosine--tRNA ligase [Spiroplasma turonicum]AKU79399.1 tyrosyl-tRNA synthetase [Spiroplasma turonicum]ALX70420.1 tyrosyl-tRNA synthetase [Spiroplasma turonicum]